MIQASEKGSVIVNQKYERRQRGGEERVGKREEEERCKDTEQAQHHWANEAKAPTSVLEANVERSMPWRESPLNTPDFCRIWLLKVPRLLS